MDINKLNQIFQDRKPGILGSENYSNYAVLLPIIEKEGDLHVLFEVRSHQLRRQPGEICFPGGRVDKTDRSKQDTAIRETSEELGIGKDDIFSVAPLDYMVNPFGTMVYPFVGFIRESTIITPNPAEVEEVFTVPLTYLQTVEPDIYHINFKLEPEEGFPFDKIAGGKKYNWQLRRMEEYFYYYEDKVIWGLTAKILTHFLHLLKK